MMNSPLFITLEGGEGGGKSTLIRGLFDYFKSINREIILTREPGGTDGAEAIRDLLVKGSANRWNPMSEICLFYAAREDHIERVIKPALNNGKIVISDRFFDSTRAYQGELGNRENIVIKCLEENIVGPCLPDLTIILDIDVKIGLARANSRNDNEGRFEAKKLEFHEKLRQNFLKIAQNEPERCKVIDATLPPDQVLKMAIELCQSKMASKNG